MNVHYHPRKVNIVAYDLSILCMGSVAHAEEQRRELVKHLHRLIRLGFGLMSISKSGVTIKYGAV